jgi:siroheme synthase
MGKKVVLDEAVVIGKLKGGLKQREIADEFGVSRQWVALFAKRNGLGRIKAGRPSRYNHEEILKMLNNGVTYEQVAEKIGAQSGTAVRAAIGYYKRKAN